MTNDTPSMQTGRPDTGRPPFPKKVLSIKDKAPKPKTDLEEMSQLISKIYVELVQRGN